MQFAHPRLQSLLHDPAASAGGQARRNNLAVEERVGTARQTAYEAFLQPGLRNDTPFDNAPASWTALHKRYFQEQVALADSATFRQADSLTARAALAENDWIVRVERIDNAFKDWDKLTVSGHSALYWLQHWADTLAQVSPSANPAPKQTSSLQNLGALLGRPSTPPVPAEVAELFDYWNGTVRKDHRPSFVAFQAELRDELDAPDWAQRLCIKLGLGHHFTGGAVTLALLRYRAGAVLGEFKKGQCCFCAPTVLDSEFGEYFHPSPQGCDWGFAAVLDQAAGDEALIAELLHRRIDYRPEHLWRIGQVECQPVADENLPAIRLAHRQRLRRQSGRDDFGAAP